MAQDELTLDLAPRDVTGKAVKRLRRDGSVPAVIHNHGKDSVVVSGEYNVLMKIYQQAGKHHPVNVTAGDKHFTAMIKSVDFEPKKHLLRHVVFNAVKANQKVTAEIPLHVRYDEGNESSPAERAGLMVLSNLDAVEVEALPKNLPDSLEYNGEKLAEIGDHITVGDIIVPEGVTILLEPEQTIASVFEPSAVAAANEAAAGDAKPEDQAEVPAEGEESQPEETSADDTPKTDAQQ
jgi:large subunit ribosomal protein L25